MQTKKIFKNILIFVLVFSWLFSGYPHLWKIKNFSKIKDIKAVTLMSNGTFTGGTTGWTLSTITYDSTTYYGTGAGSINIYAGRRQTGIEGFATYNTYFNINSTDTVYLDGFYRLDLAGGGSGYFELDLENQTNPGVWQSFWSTGTLTAATTGWVGICYGGQPCSTGVNISSYINTNSSYRIRARMIASGGTSSGAYGSGWMDNLQISIVNTVIGSGASEPSNLTIGPGYDLTDLANFTLKTDYPTTTDTITAAVVTLSPAGAYENISEVAITDNSNTTKCTSVTDPTSNTITFSSCNIAVTDAETSYKIRIKPKTHANMPAPNGASYAVNGLLTGITATNHPVSGSDTGSGTITIDNLSPNDATNTSGTAGYSAVTLNWTTASGENSTTTILRWAASSAGTEVPTEGSAYSAGDVISTATVACVFTNQSSATSLSKTDGDSGDAGCTTSALTNGQAYSYKIFQQDAYGNYNTGLVFTGSPFTPVLSGVHISLDTDGSVDFGTMPLSMTQTNSSSPEVIRINSGPADLDLQSTNFSHSSYTWTLGSAVNDYVVKWEYSKDNNSWSTFSVADTLYPFDTNLATNATSSLYLRVNTPTASDSNGPYGATITITASAP